MWKILSFQDLQSSLKYEIFSHFIYHPGTMSEQTQKLVGKTKLSIELYSIQILCNLLKGESKNICLKLYSMQLWCMMLNKNVFLTDFPKKEVIQFVYMYVFLIFVHRYFFEECSDFDFCFCCWKDLRFVVVPF